MKTLSCLALLLCLPLAVAAQSFDMSLSFGAANAGKRSIGRLGLDGEGTPITIGSGFLFAPRLTIHNRGHLSHEFSYVFSRGNLLVRAGDQVSLDQGMSIGQVFYNAVLSATPEGSRIRPYGTVGAGLVSFYPPGFGLFSGVTVNRPGVNYGAGVRFQVNEIWHGRVDFRQTLSPSPRLFQVQDTSGSFRQNQFSAGIGITF
jgi:opacity protein-like surface antigen